MSNWHSLLPAPYKWRELWDMSAANGLAVPSAIFGGHPLTITGGSRQTSTSGVHFDGTAASNINCGAIHNSATKLWISFRFRLDQDFGVGSSSMHLLTKRIDADNWLDIALDGTDGEIKWRLRTAAVDRFDVSGLDSEGAVITSWTAGVWYHVLASISSVNAVRFRIDAGDVATDADTTALMAGGDFVIGDEDDPGLGAGFVGTIAQVTVGTDDLNEPLYSEETDLYNGRPPSDAVNLWLLDEGRGTTATDRGSGANNGTLDTAAAWDYSEAAYPVLSFDGIADKAETAAIVDISGDITFVWVGKSRRRPRATACMFLKIDDNNNIMFGAPYGAFGYRIEIAGVATLNYAADEDTWGAPVIIIATKTASASVCYIDGATVIDQAGGEGPSGLATCYLGWVNYSVSDHYDSSAPTLAGIINGALSQTEAVRLTQKLNAIYNLGITI